MGQNDKFLLNLGDRPLIQHVIDRVSPSEGSLYLNINGNHERCESFGLPIISDSHVPSRGPLEGLLAYFKYNTDKKRRAEWVLTVPGDCPFLPRNLANTLLDCIGDSDHAACFARHQKRSHFLCCLWSRAVADELEAYLLGTNYSAKHFLQSIEATSKLFDFELYDPFFNINTPSDLLCAESLINT